MATIVRRPEIISQVRAMGESNRALEFALTARYAAKVAEAVQAANDANAAAQTASTAATTAQTAANNANTAAANAQSAANNANARAGVLEFLGAWSATPSTLNPQTSGGPAVIPEMSLVVDSGGYWLMAFFSMELDLVSGTGAQAAVQLYDAGVAQSWTYRRANPTSAQPYHYPGFIYEWKPAAGVRTVDVRWTRIAGDGPIGNNGNSRQLAIMRVPFGG